jgi:hypothetical protein
MWELRIQIHKGDKEDGRYGSKSIRGATYVESTDRNPFKPINKE